MNKIFIACFEPSAIIASPCSLDNIRKSRFSIFKVEQACCVAISFLNEVLLSVCNWETDIDTQLAHHVYLLARWGVKLEKKLLLRARLIVCMFSEHIFVYW